MLRLLAHIGPPVQVVIDFVILREIQDLVGAQRRIGAEGQVGERLPPCRQLDAPAVAPVHIVLDRIARSGQLTRFQQHIPVLHQVEVDPGAETGARIIPARLDVQHFLGLELAGRPLEVVAFDDFLDVAAARFTVAQRSGDIEFAVPRPDSQARPRIEKAPGLPEVHRQVILVIDAIHIQPDPAVLQVRIEGQPGDDQPLPTHESTHLLLDAGIEIPVVGGAPHIQRRIAVILPQCLVPKQFSIVVAIVAGKADASDQAEPRSGVPDFGIQDIIVIGHGLAEDDVALGLGCHILVGEIGRESISAQFLAGLVALVVTVAVGIVGRRRPDPAVGELVGPVKLEVLLEIIVGMVPVVFFIPLGIVIDAFRVIGAVGFQISQRRTGPSDTGCLLTPQIRQAQRIATFQPAGDSEDRRGIAPGVADIAFRPVRRECKAEIQATRQQARRAGCRENPCIVRAGGQVQGKRRFRADEGGVHIDAGTEGAGSVGRRAEAALDLDAGEQG